jgi:hypothetical protein
MDEGEISVNSFCGKESVLQSVGEGMDQRQHCGRAGLPEQTERVGQKEGRMHVQFFVDPEGSQKEEEKD